MPGGGAGGSPRKPLKELSRWELVGDLLIHSVVVVVWIVAFSRWALEAAREESAGTAAVCSGLAVFGAVLILAVIALGG